MPASPSPSPIRVAVVNDYELVVAGVAAVLSRHSERVRVVELDSRLPVASDVDVVLYDSFGQPQGEMIDVPGLVSSPDAKVLIFSWNVQPELVEASLEAGAAGYVSKSADAEALVDAIERVHRGETVRPADEAVEQPVVGRWPGEEQGLSPREAEVLALICQGLSNQEITERAYIGLNTVKTYIRSLYAKIGVESRTQAVLWGVDHGFRPDRSRRLLHDAGNG